MSCSLHHCTNSPQWAVPFITEHSHQWAFPPPSELFPSPLHKPSPVSCFLHYCILSPVSCFLHNCIFPQWALPFITAQTLRWTVPFITEHSPHWAVPFITVYSPSELSPPITAQILPSKLFPPSLHTLPSELSPPSITAQTLPSELSPLHHCTYSPQDTDTLLCPVCLIDGCKTLQLLSSASSLLNLRDLTTSTKGRQKHRPTQSFGISIHFWKKNLKRNRDNAQSYVYLSYPVYLPFPDKGCWWMVVFVLFYGDGTIYIYT